MAYAAVVVAYFPDENLRTRLERFSCHVSWLLLVDNTPGGSSVAEDVAATLPNIHLVNNKVNLGIATALNQGVTRAHALGADRVFLFDQDSEPGAEIFFGLAQALDELEAKDCKPALVGPAYFDTRQAVVFPFIRLDGLIFKRIPAEGCKPIEVDYLITSGSCVNLKAWNEVGEMDESLFIDCVDIEWGLRAKAKGLRIFGIPNLVMRHTLGEEPVDVFGFRYPLHTPLRHYYFFRNTIILLKRHYIPLGWKLQEFYKIPLRFIVYSIFTKEKLKHFKMMTQGIIDGIIGRTGIYRG